jgi:polyisoprenyl-teichoic acid--peptidoglycan teichoic acid transferase
MADLLLQRQRFAELAVIAVAVAERERVVVKRIALLMGGALVASSILFTLGGGVHAVAQQSPTATEIHRAHKGSFLPVPGKPVFILVLGSDSGAPHYGRGGTTQGGRSDSIHVLAINPAKGTATMIGIPRDSFVPIPGHGTHKINAAMFFGGPNLTIATVEALSGIKFDYYMVTNFQDFVGMAHEFAPHGLRIYVPFNMHDKDSSTDFDKGYRVLDAGRILGYARNRHSAPQGDFDRSFNQGTILSTAQAEARRQAEKNPMVVLSFLKILRRHIITDIPFTEQLKLGLLALRIDPHKVKNLVTPGTTGTTTDGSSVFIGAKGIQWLRDIADDGIVESA